MKKISSLVMGGTLMLFAILGCQKDGGIASSGDENSALAAKGSPVAGSNCSGYTVTLDRTYAGGFTTFVWTITNPNPGNGKNGTIQDLSHWAFVPGCPGPNGLEQNWDDIAWAAYRYGTSGDWTAIVPVPELQPDPSQTCSSANVFKFDFGTSGSTSTQYKLVVYGNYGTEDNFAIFKSGKNTGCCTRTIPGIGCKEEEICSLSQGYYFAKPGPTWGEAGTVTVGGHTYTEAEGRAIWDCSNAGGIPDAKKAFTQIAALKLSGASPTGNATIDADVAYLEWWLGSLPKLVACSFPANDASGQAGPAAGRIGDWINENHCDE